MLEVKQTGVEDPLTFTVMVREGAGESRHRVTMSKSTYQKLTKGKVTPERCVQAAFEYLLEREPKESILRTFDITVISRYFPRFEAEFSGYLSASS